MTDVPGALTTATIVALVQALKLAGLDNRYAAIAAILVGVCLTVVTQLVTSPIPVLDRPVLDLLGATLSGIVTGLTASGLYSTGKAAFSAIASITTQEPIPRG